MRLGLVLGGGGLVGMGYHAGVLKALQEWGLDVNRADVIVGTSAGAILGSYLAAGWSPQDFYDHAHGRHPRSTVDPDGLRSEVKRLFTPLWTSRVDRMRRSLGSLFAIASARGYWHVIAKDRMPAGVLRRIFPSGLYSTQETRERFGEDLPPKWPRPGVYLCAADLYSGRRVVFGLEGAPPAPFREAVMASIAIPGVFPPVRIEGRYYVDGGVISATSLDVATEACCDAILCVAPLGYRKDLELSFKDVSKWAPMILRAQFARSLRREVLEARRRDVAVLVIRPWLSELGIHGTNSMRHHDRVAVVEGARSGTLRLLESNADHLVLQAFSETAARGQAT
jgi:NTE family protein